MTRGKQATLPERLKTKIAVLISGTGTNMAALLFASRMADATYEIVLVASNCPDAEGLVLAKAEGIATFALSHKGMQRSDHDVAMAGAINDSGADLVALAGYMRVLGNEFVQNFAGRIINIHPSLLPKYTGLNTHARAIAAGDSHGGASVHLVTEELDAGEVLGQVEVAIQPGDTPETLASRVLVAEHQLYPRTLNAWLRRDYDAQTLQDRVAALALALPEAHARASHGSPGWRVGTEKSGKYFAHFLDQHHGSTHIAVLVKTGSMDELENLVEAQPEVYFKPAYYGASGWIGVILNRRNCDWVHVGEWLERSWRQVAPARLTRLADAADQF